MARPAPSPLVRQVARARRRLFLQGLLERTAKAWVGALTLAAVWFLVEPFVLPDAVPWLRWAVLGGLVGVATVAAVVWSVLGLPSRVAAALELDRRFQLKERATTSLTLAPDEVAGGAGQALLDDANRRVEPLRVGDRFPVRLPWTAALVPAFAGLLALLALFYKPMTGPARAGDADEPLAQAREVQAEIDQKMKQLVKKTRPTTPEDKPKSEELQRIEGELEKLARQPHETKEQAREVIKDATQLEEQIKQREKELAEKAAALKEQLKQIERTGKKDKKDGPADKLDKALQQGDVNKAKDEADRLAKRLKANEEAEKLKQRLDDPKASEEEKKEAKEQLEKKKDEQLTGEQKEKMQEQLKDIQDKLERLTRNKDEADRLREMARRGELDQEQLQRELDQLEKNSQKLDQEMPDLKEAAQKLAECQKCLKEGKEGEAAQKLAEAAAKLGRCDPNGEQQDLAEQLKQLQEAKKAMCQALDGKPIPAAGRRPEGKDHETGHTEERVRSELDKGRLQVVDYVPGDGFKGPRTPDQLKEEIRKAAQEAPEAIDRQRLPRSASDMARGFFDKMRGPEKDGKKMDK
jgi:hypothetical protein